MDQKKITDEFSVSGQLTLSDITFLKENGVKTIICNRPDKEDHGQLDADVVKKAAVDAGMEFYFMPVVSGQLSETEGKQFADLINTASKPIHAYCRSGTRCSILWTISELLAGKNINTVLEKTAAVGYDLRKMFT